MRDRIMVTVAVNGNEEQREVLKMQIFRTHRIGSN